MLQRTRYYTDTQAAEASAARRRGFKTLTIEDRIESCVALCGSPASVVKQIRRLYETFGHGITHMVFKVGNIPDDVVTHGMKLFKEQVLPEVRDLGVTVEVAA